jgi:hypothetical protein
MYENFNQIAQLKFNKEIESISEQTREKVRERQREYAALAGSQVGFIGQHEASIGRIQIDGAEQTVRALHLIWIDLITKREGHISRPDIAFIANKVDGYTRTKNSQLHRAFVLQRKGAAINALTLEADRRMHALAADLRRDLEITVREDEAFPKKIQQDTPKIETIPTITKLEKTAVRESKSASGVPRAFLSYSWDDAEHEHWVGELAKRLQGESGVEIIFDQWHLNPGGDKLHFMEQGVSDSDFVIVVCTPSYKERADKRQGGAGYESMVITAELAENILTNKFIPVLRSGTWSSSLPIYLKSKMGVNFTHAPYSEDEYEKLLRVLHGEPIQPPPIANKPDFLKISESRSKPSNALRSVEVSPPGFQPEPSCNFSPRALILSQELSIKLFPVVEESSWSDEIEFSIVADSSQIDSIFSRLRGHKDVLVIAYGFDVAMVRLRSVNRIASSGKAFWKVTFDPIRTEFSNDMEVGTSVTSADEFAEKRVRRLLLNENPSALKSDNDNMIERANEAMFEALVRGLNSVVKVERSSFIDLHKVFGDDSVKFIEIAWISAVADLKLSAAIQHIDRLTLELDQNVLNVDFSGRRHRKYVNVSPYEINVKGSINLLSDD